MKKNILFLVGLLLVVLTGCARVDSEVTISPDVKGVWNATITSEVGPIAKEAIVGELQRIGIENYTIEALNNNEAVKNDNITTSVQWKIKVPFNNEEELQKIAGMAYGTQNISEISAKKDENDSSLTNVNLGVSPSGVTKIKVEGNVIKESLKSGHIDEEGTIVFQKGETVSFQVGNGLSIWKIIGIAAAAVVVIVMGFFYYEYNKKKKEV